MASITYLFGAGAESLFNIGCGNEFANAVLKSDEKCNNILVDYVKDKLGKEKIGNYHFYPSLNESKDLLYSSEAILKARIRKKRLYENYKTRSEFKQSVDDEYQNLKDKEDVTLLGDYGNYMGLLDSDFFTLLSPIAFGPTRFWRVLLSYYRAYLYIVNGILKDGDYRKILENPRQTYIDIKNKCGSLLKDCNSYYSVLRDYLTKDDFLVTTNYTSFVDLLAKEKELKEEHVAYTHGSLKLFESAYQRKVIDVETEKDLNDDIYFPFLLLQSALKPIIEKKQIKEYAKFVNALEKSNVLLVVGYSFSIDDSEMISIVRDFLEKDNNRMIYFEFQSNDSDKPPLRTILRDDNEDKIQRIAINQNDALDQFEQCLKELQMKRMVK